MNITLSIHENGFSSFFGFAHPLFNVILPGRVNTINIVVEQWYQDNGLPNGIFFIIDMYCAVGSKRTLCRFIDRRYDFTTVDH